MRTVIINVAVSTVVAASVVAAAAGINHAWPIFGANSEMQLPSDLATKDDLESLVTRDELELLATQADLEDLVTRSDAEELAEDTGFLIGTVALWVASVQGTTPDFLGIVEGCIDVQGKSGLRAALARGMVCEVFGP